MAVTITVDSVTHPRGSLDRWITAKQLQNLKQSCDDGAMHLGRLARVEGQQEITIESGITKANRLELFFSSFFF